MGEIARSCKARVAVAGTLAVLLLLDGCTDQTKVHET